MFPQSLKQDEATTPSPPESQDGVAALRRIARLSAQCFGVAFAQVVRFGEGDGMASEPVSFGTFGGQKPDLRLACVSIPSSAEVVVVEDAEKDARFGASLPSEVRFFALASIIDGGGARGALCLLHDEPKQLGTEQMDQLVDFAALAGCALGGERVEIKPPSVPIDSEGHFGPLGEAVFDALLVTENGIILDANQRVADLLGIQSAKPLIGRHVTDLVPEDQIEKVRKQLLVSGHYEVDIVHALGHAFRIEVQAASFEDNGRALRVAAFRPAIGG